MWFHFELSSPIQIKLSKIPENDDEDYDDEFARLKTDMRKSSWYLGKHIWL